MNNLIFLYKSAEAFHELSVMTKLSYIKKLKNGKYRVVSKAGKNLGTYDSKDAAKKRLRQVEYFKHLKKKASENKLDLSEIEKLTYSSIMRQINKQLGKEACMKFATIYKKIFDKNLSNKNLLEGSLAQALKNFNKHHQVVAGDKIKTAATKMESSDTVAKYLSNIIKFTLSKISAEKRGGSLNRVKTKLSKIDPRVISEKKLPASSAMGQSITFVKHTLFGQDPQYVKSVIEKLIRYL